MSSDPRYFKLNRTGDTGENWVLRVNNLKKLYKLIMRYYEEKLGQPSGNLETPNLNSIARDAEMSELLKLGQLIIALAVQCERNQIYITKIQGLNQRSQHAMMLAIEQVMTRLAAGDDETEPSTPVPETPSLQRFEFNEHDEQLLRMRSEMNRLVAEKEDAERLYREMENEHSRLRYSYDDLLGEREEMKQRVRELERSLGQAKDVNKGEFLMRTEIDALKTDLEKSEAKINEYETTIDSQSLMISDFTRKVEDLTKRADQATKLKDQLQENKHAAEKLTKTELALDKYKKKAEESGDLRKQVKTLEDQNNLLIEKVNNTEDEYRKVMAFKPMMESYKDQVQQLTSKVNQMVIERNKLEYDIRRYQERLTLSELEKQRDQDQMHILEDRIKELELGAVGLSMVPQTPGGSRVPDAQQERTTFELKSKITGLEREIDSLRLSRTQEGADQRVILLESMLDDANRLKIKFEQDFIAAQKQNQLLDNEISRLRSGVDHDLSLTLRQRLNESEDAFTETKKRLAETEVALEESRKELIIAKSNLTMVDKDKIEALNEIRKEAAAELVDLQRDHVALKMRVEELENVSHEQLERINQLLGEKDQMQGQVVQHKDQLLVKEREVSELKATLALQDTKDQHDQELQKQSVMTEQRRNARLTEQISELQEQIKQLQIKMQKAKEFIRQQDRLFKETRSNLDTKEGSYEEAVSSLQSEVRTREEEVSRLREALEELGRVRRREQMLMMSAWYEMGRRIQREGLARSAGQVGGALGVTAMNSGVSGGGGVSWLAQQRRMADLQTKRR